MKCCLLNIQSSRNKSVEFVDYIWESKIDIAVLTEAWLKPVDVEARIDATPTGYSLLNCPRPNRIGGGTAILVRDTFNVKKCRTTIIKSFEYSDWIVVSYSFKMRLVVIYRLPYSATHPVTTSAFISEFSELL